MSRRIKVKIKCPYCGIYSKKYEINEYGSMMRKCQCCHNVYFSDNFVEPALGIMRDGVQVDILNAIRAFFFSAVYIYSTISIFIESSYSILNTFLPELINSAILLPVIFLFFRSSELFLAERHLPHGEQLSALVEKRYYVWESLSRLENKTYLDFLVMHDVDVPRYFYDRLGLSEEYNKIYVAHKIRSTAQKIADTEDMEKIMDEQRKYIGAKNLLAHGINSKEFAEAASAAKITPKQLKEHCESVMKRYGELHRQWNNTHDKPIPWPGEQ